MQSLTGIINYLPIKPVMSEGKKRLGRLLITEGEKVGQEIKFDLLQYPPPLAVRTGISVRLQGTWRDDDVFEVPTRDDISLQLTRQDMNVLLDKNFPHLDIGALLEACGVVSLQGVAEKWRTDRQMVLDAAVKVADEEMAQKLDRFFFWYHENEGLAELCQGLEKFKLTYELDIPQIINIYDLLAHRAKRWGTTVWKAIEKDPWLITQAEDVPFSAGEFLASQMSFKGPTEAQVAGAIMHVLWGMARSAGHTYVPVNIVYGRVLGKLRQGIKKDNENEAEESGTEKKDIDKQKIGKIFYQLLGNMDYEVLKEQRRWALRGGFKYDKTFASLELADDYRKLYSEGVLKEKTVNGIESKGKGVYFTGLYWSEVRAAKILSRLCEGTVKSAPWLLGNALQFFPNLDEEQRQAIETAATYPVTIIVGQAGTGKTEVVAALTSAFKEVGLKVALMAPTGVAAQRLAEKTGNAASTMHLKLAMTKDAADYAAPGNTREIGVEEDVLIVDEMSMCDINLFAKLLNVVKPDYLDIRPSKIVKRLILTGDPSQLNSPGPGNVLGDLLEAVNRGYITQGLKVVELQTIYRQSSVQSSVLDNCRRIRLGDKNLEYVPDLFEYIRTDDPHDALDVLLKRLERQGVLLEDILLLCPVKHDTKMRAGADALNLRLQAKYNPNGRSIPGTRFRVRDKVLCVRNDYQEMGEGRTVEFEGSVARELQERVTIYNGMRGRIISYDENEQKLLVQYASYPDPQPYRPVEADYYLDLGYASTIHKAQGAETPVVVVLDYIPNRSKFTRSLLYTAVSRVKQDANKSYSGRVYFIGPDGFVENAVDTPDKPRYSKFLYRIYAENGGQVTRRNRPEPPQFIGPKFSSLR